MAKRKSKILWPKANDKESYQTVVRPAANGKPDLHLRRRVVWGSCSKERGETIC